MGIIQELRERASALKKSIVLPESDDERVIKATAFLSANNIVETILIGEKESVRNKAADHGIELPEKVNFLDARTFLEFDILVQHFLERRGEKEVKEADAKAALKYNPLLFGAALVATGMADGCVAGSITPTGEVVRAAIRMIGRRAGIDIVSSTFLMAMPDGRIFTYADCGVVPEPDTKQLADIAIESARTHRLLTDQKPKVAMLSFSTKGSADHPRVQKVIEALNIVKQKAPELSIDGELQFDAALVPDVANRKAPGSKVAGKANVFIFPDLDAGNIGYKITERLAGGVATGPILQGLSKPMMDVSRGCNWQDIVNAVCVATLMGEK